MGEHSEPVLSEWAGIGPDAYADLVVEGVVL
jgi:hypothetical protein